jgi:thiamine pyrophosphokinase
VFLQNFTDEKGKWIKGVKYKVKQETPQFYLVGNTEFDKEEEGRLYRVGEIIYPYARNN